MRVVLACAKVLAFGAILGLTTPATAAADQAGTDRQDLVVLPFPPAPFKGHVGRTANESTPDFPKEIELLQGHPTCC